MFNPLKLLLDTNEKQISQARKVVARINELEPEVEKLSYPQMQNELAEMRKELAELTAKIPAENRSSLRRVQHEQGLPIEEKAIQSKLMEYLPRVYAFVREAYKREMGIRHFDVQLLAGVILAQGQKLVEQRTGEGKTMTFNLPLFLYSLVGRGAHLITVNDYLARRDAEYAGHIASKLGLTIAVVNSNGACFRFITDEEVKTLKGEDAISESNRSEKIKLSEMNGLNLVECDKRTAYNSDITIGINNEFGFDYLRDNMANDVTRLVQRELYFCIVDEADSILIDEARTPLIISAIPNESDTDKYTKFAKVVEKLNENEDYTVDHKSRSVLLTDAGIAKAEQLLGVSNIWEDYSMAHHIENALKAKVLFQRDDKYVVKNSEIIIVDEFTGRLMAGRRYSEGLHQAIEAKEGVRIQQEAKTHATITFQNFFRLYKVLCGGSGTIITEAEEFYKIYNLESVVIPTNNPIIRRDENDAIYRDEETKFNAVVKEIQELNKHGQPVLVGTASIDKSEILSKLLDEAGVVHNVLNAKYHESEAQIVAKAGEKGAVTVATNMAGRGTDIPLGEGVKELGGLAVIGTERHESRRIDNQLRGRSGRQGDPGYTRFYVGFDDAIMKAVGGEFFSRSLGRFMQNDVPLQLGLISRQIEGIQKKIESQNFDMRKSVVEYDDVMNKHREIFYTRRFKVLNIADAAYGKFADVFIQSNSSVASEKKKEALDQLKSMAKDSVVSELDAILDTYYVSERTLSDDSLDAIVNQILDLSPDTLLAKVFDVKVPDLAAHLRGELSKRNRSQAKEYLEGPIQRLLNNKLEEFGDDLPLIYKELALRSMDMQWVDHLENMEDVRSGIRLQSYAQRDPLVEYKRVAYTYFSDLMYEINGAVARRIFKVAKVVNEPSQTIKLQTNTDQIQKVLNEMSVDHKTINDNADKQRLLTNSGAKQSPAKSSQVVGRNDLCPCGSGIKYKKCGMINSTEHQKYSNK